jgi:hypothetical protein
VSIESPSMHVKARSYLTAGIATLGVGALALAPVHPIPNQIALAPERVISTLAVELAASSIDPITPWVQTFETAGANIATLVEFYLQKPFPLLQAVVANLGTYAAELENGQGDLIPEQIWGNVQTFFNAPWWAQDGGPVIPTEGYGSQYISDTQITGPVSFFDSLSQQGIYSGLPFILETEQFVELKPILEFTATHFSGQLVGLLGPLLAPLVSLTISFTAIGEFFEAGDVIGAINELINIPANMTNAVLNGAGFLDLTGVVNAIQPLPESIKQIGLNVGGLISPPVPADGALPPASGEPPTKFNGGVLFDSVAVTAEAFGAELTSAGLPVGWAGSVVGLGQFLGEQLVVTPPAPPPVAAEPAAAKQAAPLDILAPATTEAPAEDAAPAVADVPAEESAPAAVEVVAEDPAPAVEELAEVEAAVEAVEASESEPAEAATPAAEDSGPEAADSDKSDDDTDRSGGNDRRGAS